MVEVEVEVDLSGLTQLAAALQDEDIVVDALDFSSSILLNRIRSRFLAETSPDGSKWEPSRAALARRRAGGTGTLFDTGRLFRSIQIAPGSNSKDSEGFTQRVISTDVPYARAHQLGIGQVKRPFMGASPEDEALLTKSLEENITELVRRLNGQENRRV